MMCTVCLHLQIPEEIDRLWPRISPEVPGSPWVLLSMLMSSGGFASVDKIDIVNGHVSVLSGYPCNSTDVGGWWGLPLDVNGQWWACEWMSMGM